MTRLEELRAAIATHGRVLVLFSGGLDSALLAKLSNDVLGNNTAALTIDSPVTPRREMIEARRLAADIGIQHFVISVDDELDLPHFTSNPPDRCYHCRKVRDSLARRWAEQHAFQTIADGLNYSDLSDYRPGLKAADEDGIWHPFIEFKVSKEEIRTLTRELGLKGGDRPSMACLASRFPHGFAVTPERVERVSLAEEYLNEIGFVRARVRHFPYNLGVVEVDDSLGATGMRTQIVQQLRSLGFWFVALDLDDFVSGKMNRTVKARASDCD